jgi:hypothetical protein
MLSTNYCGNAGASVSSRPIFIVKLRPGPKVDDPIRMQRSGVEDIA